MVKDDLAGHYQADRLFSTDMKARRNGLLAGAFVLALYLSVRHVRRKF